MVSNMGKSAHKLRKRRSSPSVDRLAGIEEKLSRLLGVLTHTTGEVRSRSLSPSSSLSFLSQQKAQEAQSEELSEATASKLSPTDNGQWAMGFGCSNMPDLHP